MTRQLFEPDALFRIVSQGDDDDPPERNQPLPEAQIMTLRELYAGYRDPERFKPGDIVVRKKVAGGPYQGQPCLVLEINKHAEPFFALTEASGPSSNVFGQRHDVRILMLSRGYATAYWIESFEIEPWNDNQATQALDTVKGSA